MSLHGWQKALSALAVVAMLIVGTATKAAAFKVYTHTASSDGFLVSSHAIVSAGEILLVDTQMTLDQSQKFIEGVKKLKGKVTTVYVTHPHPDHFLGLWAVKQAFPEARLVASGDTVDAINEKGAGMLQFYRETFMGGAMAANLPTEIPALTKLEGTTLKVGKSHFEVWTFPNAEVKSAHALWNAGSSALFTGDLAYNHVHLWLADEPPPGWIAALTSLQKLKPKKIYPGHGEPGGPELLKANLEYLRFFEEAIASSKSADELASKVKVRFTKDRLPMIVDLSVKKYFPPPAAPAPADAGTGR